jgi:hypothetical protein
MIRRMRWRDKLTIIVLIVWGPPAALELIDMVKGLVSWS